jgi:AMP deaminase
VDFSLSLSLSLYIYIYYEGLSVYLIRLTIHFDNFFLAKERLYPVADATSFFTDLHFILRVIADGNIRTVCHNRLILLEQVMMNWFIIALQYFTKMIVFVIIYFYLAEI